MDILINQLNKIQNKYYYFLFFIWTIALFFLTESIYEFDLDITTGQDARYYIKIANNPSEFLNLNPYYSSRILAPLLSYLLNLFTGISIFYSFKILVSVSFFVICTKLFNFFVMTVNQNKSETVLWIFLLNFINWVIIYNFFNPYQLLDILTILILISILIAYQKQEYNQIFFWSLLGIMNKHYILICILLIYFQIFYKNSDDKIKSILTFHVIFLSITFFILHYFSGIFYLTEELNYSIIDLIELWIFEKFFKLFEYSFLFFIDKNLVYLFPFVFLLKKENFNFFFRKNVTFFIYPVLMSLLLIIMYDKFKGENFSRIFYQSFYPLFILIILKNIKNTQYEIKRFIILLISCILICIEYLLFIKFNHGNFVSYMVFDRYNLIYCPIYFISILFLYLNIKEKINV